MAFRSFLSSFLRRRRLFVVVFSSSPSFSPFERERES